MTENQNLKTVVSALKYTADLVRKSYTRKNITERWRTTQANNIVKYLNFFIENNQYRAYERHYLEAQHTLQRLQIEWEIPKNLPRVKLDTIPSSLGPSKAASSISFDETLEDVEVEVEAKGEEEEDSVELNVGMADAEEKANIRKTAQQLLFNYDGNVNQLQSFLDGLEVLNDEVTAAQQAYAVRLIKTKLNGEARLAITNEATIGQIIAALRGSVKPDPKTLAEAKVLNLRQANKPAQDYVKELTELTKNLRLSYMAEGLTPDTAKKFAESSAIKSLATNCSNRKIAETLQQSTCDDYQTLAGKFLECSSKANDSSSIFFVKKFDKGHKFNQRGRGRGGHNSGQHSNSNNSNRGNGYRGRGRGRGNNRQNNQSYQENSVRVIQENPTPQPAHQGLGSQ